MSEKIKDETKPNEEGKERARNNEILKNCSLCNMYIPIGESVVWHFMVQHPERLFDILDDTFSETFLQLSKTIKLNYITTSINKKD